MCGGSGFWLRGVGGGGERGGVRLGGCRGGCRDLDSLGAAFAGDEDSDTLEELDGRRGTFGEEDVGASRAVIRGDGAGDDHGRETGVEILGPADQFITVHARHEEVTEKKIDGSGNCSCEVLERFVGSGYGNDPVTPGGEEKRAYRQDLFVIVYAKYGLLGAHGCSNSALARRRSARRRMGFRGVKAGWPGCREAALCSSRGPLVSDAGADFRGVCRTVLRRAQNNTDRSRGNSLFGRLEHETSADRVEAFECGRQLRWVPGSAYGRKDSGPDLHKLIRRYGDRAGTR